MPPRPDYPLRKVTLNLYESDCLAAEKLYGHGWSTELRSLWHEHIYSRTNKSLDPTLFQRLTLGDLGE